MLRTGMRRPQLTYLGGLGGLAAGSMLGRGRLAVAHAGAARRIAPPLPAAVAGLWRPLLLRQHRCAPPAAAAATGSVQRRGFATAPAAEHPLDEFFEPPDEDDPENMMRYAGRAWKMEELRNKVRAPPGSFVCAAQSDQPRPAPAPPGCARPDTMQRVCVVAPGRSRLRTCTSCGSC